MDQSQGGFALVLLCSFAFIFRQGPLQQGPVEATGVIVANDVIFDVIILLVYRVFRQKLNLVESDHGINDLVLVQFAIF